MKKISQVDKLIDSDNFILAILTFGDRGFEVYLTTNQEAFDLDYVNIMGNYYSPILQQHNQKKGKLYGPLPIFHRNNNIYQLMLFACNSFNPEVTDPRAIQNSNIVNSEILIFYASEIDVYLNNLKENINLELNFFMDPFLKKSIFEMQKKELIELQNNLLKQLEAHIVQQTHHKMILTNQTSIIHNSLNYIHNTLINLNKTLNLAFVLCDLSFKTTLLELIVNLNLELLCQFKVVYSDYECCFEFSNMKITIISFNRFKYDKDKTSVMYIATLDDNSNQQQVIDNFKKIFHYYHDNNCILSLCLFDNRTDYENLSFLKDLQGRSLLLAIINNNSGTIFIYDIFNIIEKLFEILK